MTGCPCGCMTKRPYLLDPDCTAVWPIRDDPVCGGCGTLLDPDGTCFTCAAESVSSLPLLPEAPAERCFGCGELGHYRAQCSKGKR